MKIKNLPYYLLLVLIGLVAVMAYRYHLQQQETLLALQLKVKLLEERKKAPVPWEKLLAAAPAPPSATTAAEAVPPVEPAEPERRAEIPIDRQPTSVLARKVDTALANREELSLDQIDRAIEMAEELIQREPASYSAYKAKLILLLTKESGHLADVDDDDVEALLEEMATFDMMSNVALRKEALLIARTDAQIDTVEESIENLETDLDAIDIDLETVAADSAEETELLEEMRTLERKIDEQVEERDRLEDNLEADLLANEIFFNEDIIEIPLQRGLATGDYDSVIAEAEALLDEFGESVAVYYYLIRALELDGQADVALDMIAASDLSAADSRELERRLRRSHEQNPRDYWKRLRF